MKQIQGIPLAERLQRMKDGQPAYPEYISGVLQNLAGMPIEDFLAGLEAKQQQRFFELVGCPGGCTYQWAAARIQCLHETNPKAAGEAVHILAMPVIRYYQYTRSEAER